MTGNRKRVLTQIIIQWLPALILMGLIFYASSIPSDEMPNFGSADTLVKKSGHFLGYAMLGLAYLRGIKSLNWRSCALALCFVILYALSDEFHQSYVPGRTSTLVDVGIDTLGAASGLLGATLFHPLGRAILARVENSKD